MAEGQEDTNAAPQEPSMEEILASIRKIISDDEKPAEQSEETAPVVVADDVVELTQMVQDDGSVVDVKAAEPTPVAPPPPVSEPKVMDTPPAPSQEKSLVSDTAISSSATALSSLANTVEIERLASNPMTATSLGNGGRTLEDMAIELMRPLLKDWLEKNLPATVDRLVQKEIERISKKV